MFWSNINKIMIIGYEVRVQGASENDLCGTDFCVHEINVLPLIWKRNFFSSDFEYFVLLFPISDKSPVIKFLRESGFLKGVLHHLLKIIRFHVLSQNYQQRFENKIHASYSKLSKKLKTHIKISVGQAVLELLLKTIFWLFWFVT